MHAKRIGEAGSLKLTPQSSMHKWHSSHELILRAVEIRKWNVVMDSDGNVFTYVVCADVLFDALILADFVLPRPLWAKLAHSIRLHPDFSHQAT